MKIGYMPAGRLLRVALLAAPAFGAPAAAMGQGFDGIAEGQVYASATRIIKDIAALNDTRGETVKRTLFDVLNATCQRVARGAAQIPALALPACDTINADTAPAATAGAQALIDGLNRQFDSLMRQGRPKAAGASFLAMFFLRNGLKWAAGRVKAAAPDAPASTPVAAPATTPAQAAPVAPSASGAGSAPPADTGPALPALVDHNKRVAVRNGQQP